MYGIRVTVPIILCGLLAACANQLGEGGGDGLDVTRHDDSSFALISSTGEIDALRRGETLSVQIGMGELSPNSVYRAEVVTDGEVVSATDVLTDLYGGVLLSALMHDVGEEGEVTPGQVLSVRVFDPFGDLAAQTEVSLDAPPILQVPGYNVTEVDPPHVFAADASGAPRNAFAVGGRAAGEIVGPVHVAGDGFPMAAAGGMVHVYAVVDGDDWRGSEMPTAGDPAHVAGPIEAYVDEEGRLQPTAIFEPGLEHVGIYDLLVDVDRDGRFEWNFNSKDGADGLAKVGFTVQYSQQWLEERTSRHLLVNIAYDSHGRGDGAWRNVYSAGEPVFLYLNPPVMHEYHFAVTKVIVRHQDFDAYWNDPSRVDPACGGVPYRDFETRSMAVVTERGCTNTSPTCFGPIDTFDDGEDTDGDGTLDTAHFDVVFDRDADGCYDIGEDLLDTVSGDAGGGIISVDDFFSLSPEQRRGFTVSR